MPAQYTATERKAAFRRVCALLAEGKSLRQACIELDMRRQEIYVWCDKYPDFAAQYAEARALGERVRIDEAEEKILTADDWRAAKFYLERRDAKRYAPAPDAPAQSASSVEIHIAGDAHNLPMSEAERAAAQDALHAGTWRPQEGDDDAGDR